MTSIGLENTDRFAEPYATQQRSRPRPAYKPTLAAKVAAIDDPIMEAAADAMGATPDDLLEYIELQRSHGLTTDEIRDVLKALGSTHHELEGKPDTENALTVRTANETIEDAKLQEIPLKLFGTLEAQGELIIEFGEAGSNKTVLAVQVINDVTKGMASLGVDCEVSEIRSLLVDLELSKKQFQNRYSENYSNEYQFSDHFARAEFNRECNLPEKMDFERFLLVSIEAEVQARDIKYLVIDNMSALKAATEKSYDAGPFMNELNRIKRQYGLTIKIIAHTPKRDSSRPISINDLAGSKVISNLADSVYAIGRSHADPTIRYIKQLKARSFEVEFGESKVLLYRVTKPSNFLGLEFLGHGNERDHLAQFAPSDSGGRRLNEAVEFLQKTLARGPVASHEVKQKAERAGIAQATLRRAREALDVEMKWGAWKLPTKQENATGELGKCGKCREICSPGEGGMCILCEAIRLEANNEL